MAGSSRSAPCISWQQRICFPVMMGLCAWAHFLAALPPVYSGKNFTATFWSGDLVSCTRAGHLFFCEEAFPLALLQEKAE